jgi:hypothetical protein
MRNTWNGLMGFLVAALALSGCAGKKDPASNNFGAHVHQAKFTGAKDFLAHYGRVMEIMTRDKLDGEPVDMSWIEPNFREQLCLTVTIHNHCVA